jgi:hypothetical protein
MRRWQDSRTHRARSTMPNLVFQIKGRAPPGHAARFLAPLRAAPLPGAESDHAMEPECWCCGTTCQEPQAVRLGSTRRLPQLRGHASAGAQDQR